MTAANDNPPVDPEDPLAEIAAESTQDSTPSKSLYGDKKTKETPTREPAHDRSAAVPPAGSKSPQPRPPKE